MRALWAGILREKIIGWEEKVTCLQYPVNKKFLPVPVG